VTGPTGCGKTTTLYAALNEINDPKVNITTAEDPVEFGMTGVNQLHVREMIDLTFSTALRSFLRQDPDIIMVGEIRDKQTAEIAIRASLTGHLVLSTVHTNTAAATVTRLINMGVEPFLIASTLIMVVSQRLLRTLCPSCKEAYEPPPELLAKATINRSQIDGSIYRAKGCPACHETGYKGRIGVFEVMPVTPAVKNLIVQRATTNKIEDLAVQEGMSTLREAALLKLSAGVTDLTEVLKETTVE
jgi:type II secretory ATPase GspE/PulE/Tfp pilus assembly ATPase PilB-like protein